MLTRTQLDKATEDLITATSDLTDGVQYILVAGDVAIIGGLHLIRN